MAKKIKEKMSFGDKKDTFKLINNYIYGKVIDAKLDNDKKI